MQITGLWRLMTAGHIDRIDEHRRVTIAYARECRLNRRIQADPVQKRLADEAARGFIDECLGSGVHTDQIVLTIHHQGRHRQGCPDMVQKLGHAATVCSAFSKHCAKSALTRPGSLAVSTA